MQCPYCHGHEHRDEPTALLGRGDTTFNEARLLRGWTDDLTVVTNGPEDLSAEQEAVLTEAGTKIIRTSIAHLQVTDGQVEAVVFEDGSVIPCRAFYVQPPQRQGSDLAERLGVPIADKGCYETDRDGRTAVPGVFIVGDASDGPQSIAVAVAEGQWAGMAANFDLVVGPPEG
jgi:thioredoxin reductase